MMTATNYKDASRDTKLAFIIGFLSGSLACERMKRLSKQAYLAWAKARSAEADAMCAELDRQTSAAAQVEILYKMQLN